MTAPRPLGLNGLAALVTALVLSACGGESGSGDDGPAQAAFEADLEALPGVADARVDREAFDTEYYGEEIVVDMTVEATPRQVTTVLDALRERRRTDEGKPQDARVTLGAGHTDTVGDDFTPDAAPQVFSASGPRKNARMARLLVDAVRALPGRNVMVGENSWEVFAATKGGDPRVAIDKAAAALMRDDRLAATGNLGLTGVSGTGADRRTAILDVARALTPEVLARWTKASGAFDHPLVRSLLFVDGGNIFLDMRLPDDVRPRQLTTAKYGGRLWPIIRSELDLLADVEGRATLSVTNQYEADGSSLEDRFLEVTSGRPARRDRHGRAWNAEGTAYLDQVLATR